MENERWGESPACVRRRDGEREENGLCLLERMQPNALQVTTARVGSVAKSLLLCSLRFHPKHGESSQFHARDYLVACGNSGGHGKGQRKHTFFKKRVTLLLLTLMYREWRLQANCSQQALLKTEH